MGQQAAYVLQIRISASRLQRERPGSKPWMRPNKYMMHAIMRLSNRPGSKVPEDVPTGRSATD